MLALVFICTPEGVYYIVIGGEFTRTPVQAPHRADSPMAHFCLYMDSLNIQVEVMNPQRLLLPNPS